MATATSAKSTAKPAAGLDFSSDEAAGVPAFELELDVLLGRAAEFDEELDEAFEDVALLELWLLVEELELLELDAGGLGPNFRVALGNWDGELLNVSCAPSVVVKPCDDPVVDLMTEPEAVWMTMVPVSPLDDSALESRVWSVPASASYDAPASMVIVIVAVLLTAPGPFLDVTEFRKADVGGWPSMLKLPLVMDCSKPICIWSDIWLTMASISSWLAWPLASPCWSACLRNLLASVPEMSDFMVILSAL